ncbi:DUF2829 domain-containing protein [Methylobacterium sp. J-090]|uniref:DUF2829 domain-containing protein n=1 Tax=Methylobacterium sp. J-090 TaxID=2836666 RepID=UPI001FBA37CD|nr:DUF2829 domain-containing protein [Methylobacterium sp. J-090]MCJ2084202.1 DUF2829 domain-containing protein [Methylobacterium sp. J-090]
MGEHVTPSGITVEFRQHDFMPGFAAYLHQEGKPFPDGKAFCAIDLSAILLSHAVTDGTRAELAETIADTMVHEVIHVIEAWAGAEFSEARVEGLIARYRGHASGYGDAAADDGMDFSSALYLARTEGARIHRKGWEDDSCWRIEGGTLKAQWTFSPGEDEWEPRDLSPTDILAEDWEVVS